MDAFVHNGAVFVQAAEEVVAAYAQADTLSGDQFKTQPGRRVDEGGRRDLGRPA